MRRLLALLLVLAGPAAAADISLPALFDVAGVSAGDVLNVRAAADAGSPVIGTLAPDARGIEVVATDAGGGWGRINLAEQSGWVAMRYLAVGTGVGGGPPALACFGTEPFWSLRPGDGKVVFATPDAAEETLPLTSVLDTGIPGDQRRALVAAGPERRLTAMITPQDCSDGMSDRAFGLGVAVIDEAAGAPRLLTGCCSIAP